MLIGKTFVVGNLIFVPDRDGEKLSAQIITR